MGEILSQSEIDSLLSALSSGEVNAEEIKKEEHKKKIRVYDFKRPNKFSKDQLHTLQVIHENYGRLLTTYFSAHLRSLVIINVLSVEQLTYDEFVRSIPNPTILNIITMAPLEGNSILEMNPVVAFTILDRLFGGPGKPPDKTRSLTDIERTVMERLAVKILDLLREAWENIIPLNPMLETIETNPQFTQIVAPTEMVVLVTLETKIGDGEGLINLCIPYLVLEPIINKLSAHFWFSRSSKEATTEHIQMLQKRIQKTQLNLTTILGHANVSVREMMELQQGDVIPLDHKVSEPLEVFAGPRRKFKGLPGMVGSKMAVQITEVIKEGDDEDE